MAYEVQPGTPSEAVPTLPTVPMEQLSLPVFAFVFKEPVAGWPHTRSWLTTLASILSTGYDAARTEPVLFTASAASAVSGGTAIKAGTLQVKKGFTRLTCCGWLLMHAVQVDGDLPDDVKQFVRSMISFRSTFSPSKGAAEDAYENIFMTNRAAMRQRTSFLKLCAIFNSNIKTKDLSDPEGRSKLSDCLLYTSPSPRD